MEGGAGARAGEPPSPLPAGAAPSRRGRVWRGLVLALAVVVALDQLVLHLVLRDGEAFGHRVAPFQPPLPTARQVEALARIEGGGDDAPILAGVHFDAELGWCPRPDTELGPFRYDRVAARVGRAPTRDVRPGRRVLAIGDSFVRGDEVSGAECWTSLVTDRLEDGEVVNHGVGAYGVDQALLRLRRDGLPLAPHEVWLGIFPQALTRVLNVYRPALQRWTPDLAFKPRFLLEGAGGDAPLPPGSRSGGGPPAGGPAGAGLVLRPLPVASLAEVSAVVRSPGRFLEAVGHADHWIERDRAAYAEAWSSPWHYTAAGRAWLTWTARRPRLAAPLLGDPTSELRRLVGALVEAMARDCDAAGARLSVIVLPGRDGLRRRHGAGEAPWVGLVADLRGLGLEVLDLADDLEDAGARQAPRFWRAGGHYAPEGHQVVVSGLERVGWLP